MCTYLHYACCKHYITVKWEPLSCCRDVDLKGNGFGAAISKGMEKAVASMFISLCVTVS